MAWDSSWTSLMPHTVQVAQRTGWDGNGKATFGSNTAYTARVVAKPTKVRTRDGQETVADTVVWIKDASGLTPGEDRLTLPDGSTPPILAVQDLVDEGGKIGEKAFCGGG